ncbi:helicase, partial [Escherichia coli]
NVMWENFQKEVDRARRASVREYTFTDRDYVERSSELAGVESDSAYISDSDSYLNDIDFNALFEQKRNEISDSVTQQIEKIKQSGIELPEDALEALRQTLAEKAVQKAAEIIDPELIEKRPHQARKLMRGILKTRTQDAVANLLIDNNIGEKSSELYDIFNRYVP